MNGLVNIWELTFSDWRYRVAAHVGFWIFLLFYWMQESVVIKVTWYQHYSVTLTGILFPVLLFYPLVYLIVPLFRKKHWLAGVLLFIVYYVAAVLLRDYHIRQIVSWYNMKQTWIVGQDFWKQVFHAEFRPAALAQIFFSSIPSLVEIIMIPLILKFIRYAYQVNIRQARLARQNSQLQLNSLKAQLNPHFFFNTLNNLQSFIVQNEKEKSVDLLSRLADLMRISLYDCTAEQITIAQEISLLSNYAAIERVRFEDDADIMLSLIDNDPEYLVPPFLFLPFVENAFKHGGAVAANEVTINITLENDPQKIRLTTANRFLSSVDRPGGIGLKNVQERLDYYFAGRYTLEVKQSPDLYSVTLELCKG